jgi:hypothetical protein
LALLFNALLTPLQLSYFKVEVIGITPDVIDERMGNIVMVYLAMRWSSQPIMIELTVYHQVSCLSVPLEDLKKIMI